jgi:hypothetical protein
LPCDVTEVREKLEPNVLSPRRIQFSAESSQSSYLEVLSTQDEIIGDYTSGSKPVMSAVQREQVVELIEHLHRRKGYRIETFHCAVSIMDRFLWQVSKQKLAQETLSWPHLATICMLMAAKLQQPVSPSFNKMIEQLPEKYRTQVTK